jgi:hypothetical protein
MIQEHTPHSENDLEWHSNGYEPLSDSRQGIGFHENQAMIQAAVDSSNILTRNSLQHRPRV